MGNRSSRVKKDEDKPKEMHPIWRGIGCVMLVLIPLISYAAALVVLQEGPKRGWTSFITNEMMAPGADPFLYVKIGLTVVFMVILYMVFILFSFLIERMVGGSGYGPLDVKPEAYKGKEYKR
jgi:hypothetical protein